MDQRLEMSYDLPVWILFKLDWEVLQRVPFIMRILWRQLRWELYKMQEQFNQQVLIVKNVRKQLPLRLLRKRHLRCMRAMYSDTELRDMLHKRNGLKDILFDLQVRVLFAEEQDMPDRVWPVQVHEQVEPQLRRLQSDLRGLYKPLWVVVY